MSAPWSPSQLRILAALGHAVYRPVAGWTSAPAGDGAANRFDAATLDFAIDPTDALVVAISRAAGLDAHACPDLPDWWHANGLPAPVTLRADATAKRALWSRLRALRAGRG